MDRYKVTKKAGLLGILGNLFLLIIKASVGFISNSQAMIADSANSAGDILIAHNNGTYQFPGGHKEDNETLDESLEREIKETSIEAKSSSSPIASLVTYLMFVRSIFTTRSSVLSFHASWPYPTSTE